MPNEQLILPGQQVRAADVIHLRRKFNSLVIAGKGLVGGGPINDDLTLDVGQGDGLLVSEDAVAVDLTATVPPSVNLTAGQPGTSKQSARADHRHLLDLAIEPTWTGRHVFQRTTEQARLSYDATHYVALTVDAAGNFAIAPIGGTLSTPTAFFADGGVDIGDGVLSKNGVPIPLGAGSSPIATDALWDAVGDLVVGTGVDTAARLAIGADGLVLTAQAGGSVAWEAVPGGGIATDPLWDTTGDLAVGTGANTAAKLALTVPAANILEVLGVVNGETAPTWKALHDATVPSTQAFGDAAAAGTALTAAHRDHKHAMPAVPKTVATDVLWDATGDLAVGSGNDTAAKLTKGADGTLLGVVAGAVGWVSALAANLVDGAAIRLANAQWLRARNAANTADVNVLQVNASGQLELGAPLVLLQTALSADVVCTIANTYYNGPSVTLTAGTWLLVGSVQITSASAGSGYADAKLWDGTTAMASGEFYLDPTGLCNIALMGIVTISSTTVCSIAVATQQALARIRAAMQSGIGGGAGNNASTLRAIKIG